MAKRKNSKKATKGASTSESTKSDVVDATAVDVSETPVDVLETDAESLETTDYDRFQAGETPDVPADVETSDVESTMDVEPDIDAETIEMSDESDDTEFSDESYEPEPDYVVEPLPVQPEPARASVLPLILAGIVTAVLGFLAARSDLLLQTPRADTPQVDPAIAEGLADVTNRLTALEATVAALPAPAAEVDLDPINNQIGELVEQTGTIAPIAERLDALTEQVDAIAARPQVDVSVPEEALNAALAELRDTSSKQQAEIDTLLDDARAIRVETEAAANAALQRAALAKVMSAVDTGSPFATALGDLEQAGATDVPDALKSAADAGVAPLAVLQESFPDAARTALAAARNDSKDSSGLGGFLQRQLGTRSVSPREGSDADAVLSRMDAAMRAGDLENTLVEVDQLPEPAREAMAAWLEQAQMRSDAVSAANTLADRLSAL